jgi:HK97 family phage prohead protease
LTHHGYEVAAYPSRQVLPEFVRDWRANRATCRRCGQRILSVSRLVTRGDECFHADCAKRHDQQQQRQAAPSTAQTAIGTVVGIALPFGVPCSIEHRTADGDVFSRSEQFAHGAFTESIERGGQALKIDHCTAVPGRLTLFGEGPDLRFRFRVHDSMVGRRLLDHVRRDEARGASIAFRARRIHYGFAHVEVVDEAELTEISVCIDGKPAWYSTSVWEEV